MRPATEPPEVRGRGRDDVRLLVAGPDGTTDAAFRDLPHFLRPGDLLVVNDSATLPAAVDGTRNKEPVTLHFATALDDGAWVVEVRPAAPDATGPLPTAARGDTIDLPAGARLTLDAAYPDPTARRSRLWRGTVAVEAPLASYLERHGRPIAYAYVPRRWPLAAYQTVFATTPGSAEMPSAARPFTTELVTRLVTYGVAVAPVTLHTGLSSQEAGEPPLPERFRVPTSTAALVHHTKRQGHRVIAVGTTVTRALETGTAGGWTDLVLGPERPARVVDGIVSGWHNDGASHIRLLEAVAGRAVVAAAYERAEALGYLMHEFGDSALLLRG
jgi:S-adenosylmethionine:tRNA ribosyltransferase-isomerase